MNLPFDKIHDPLSSYGHILIPWPALDNYGQIKWIAWFKPYGLRKTDVNGFHNCRVTGIK